jgi:putative tricarboxylic transport membrane protein
MKKRAIIEGITLLVLSLLGVVEGFRLNIVRDAHTSASMLGPGTYILVLGFGLMITALVNLFLKYREASAAGKAALDERTEMPVDRVVIALIGTFALYAALIDIIGYVIPTIIFFLIAFRLLGVRSWITNIVLTSVVVAVFYGVFVHYCEMIFPHGILFE